MSKLPSITDVIAKQIIYEDNHLIILNKLSSQIIQGDKTGDIPLGELVKIYLKETYNKPGEVFLSVIHRLDRPVSGVVIFAKTDKAMTRMAHIFQKREIKKVYWAISRNKPKQEYGHLINFLKKNEQQNKSYVYDKEIPGSHRAELKYQLIDSSDSYYLIEVELMTGKHHQIRAQLASIGCPLKGDVKYGALRPNRDISISLHARSVSFIHPIKKENFIVIAPVPEETLWQHFEKNIEKRK
ncbi:MAG: RNA pseudouridine synthase [Bacteroidetes bacterium]|nr:RNA pseudouridine synthase [Bacteroidota bacterium]